MAVHNQRVLDCLVERIDEFPDWVATVAFYKALHVVEAVFYRAPGVRNHGQSHEDRENILKRTRRFRELYNHYRPLWSASMVARYIGDRETKFTDYMSPDMVQSKLLDHHLHRLQESARKFLPKKLANQL